MSGALIYTLEIKENTGEKEGNPGLRSRLSYKLDHRERATFICCCYIHTVFSIFQLKEIYAIYCMLCYAFLVAGNRP